MKRNLIVLSVFLIPIIGILPVTGTICWFPQLMALVAIGLICAALQLWKMNKFISLFLIYLVFSYIFVCGTSVRSMLMLMFSFSAMFLAYFVSKLEDVKPIYYALIAMVVLNSVYVVVQYLNIDPFFKLNSHQAIDRMVGFMGSRNQLGVFQAAIGTITVGIFPLAFFLLIIPLFLIKATTSMVGMMAGLFTYFLFSGNKKIVAILIGITILLVPFFFSKKSDELKDRIRLCKLTLKQSFEGKAVAQINKDTKRIFTANPWVGYGIGRFFEISPLTQTILFGKSDRETRFEHVHNDSVEALFEFGYLGFIIFLCCVFSVIFDFFMCLHLGHPNTKYLILSFSSLVTLAVCSFGTYIVHAPVSLFMLALMLGLFYREVRYAKQSQIS